MRIPNVREVNVYRDGEILSGVGPPSAKLLCVSNSNTVDDDDAVESEGEGWPYFCFKCHILFLGLCIIYGSNPIVVLNMF